jgi:hypothetical protein
VQKGIQDFKKATKGYNGFAFYGPKFMLITSKIPLLVGHKKDARGLLGYHCPNFSKVSFCSSKNLDLQHSQWMSTSSMDLS